MDGLKPEKVSDTLTVYQKSGVFCYGTDAVLLVKNVLSYYKSLGGKIMCDLCSGTGIIPLMLCDSQQNLKASAVEINETACEISKMSANVSNLSGRVNIINGDIKEIRSIFPSESFDFVTCNPPYMTSDSGKMCTDDYKTIARHEILCNIYDVFAAAFYLLRTGGNFFVVYRSDRLASLFDAAKQNRFQIKEMHSYISSTVPALSKLTVIRATKDASEGMKHFISNIN
ncbi:MAG: methyltransferase [Clostridia bacterium]|nr:methyltransferase [Clostridia bacterium]